MHDTAIRMAPGLRLVRAPNPSPMTHTGTNTWILGTGEVAVIDPGPDLTPHHDAILAALEPGERIGHILVTHAHRDHAPLARTLSKATGAPVLAAGDMVGRRRPIMAVLARDGLIGGGEGVDERFAPDIVLADGDSVAGSDWAITAVATPGHTADHLAFVWGDAVFTGDHVMGWASSLVSPPDGDVTSFMASCARLATLEARVFYPGHGEPVPDPAARLDWLVGHRRAREAQIVEALRVHGAATPEALTRRIYVDTPPALHPAAARNVLAHLVALIEEGRAGATPRLAADATFHLI